MPFDPSVARMLSSLRASPVLSMPYMPFSEDATSMDIASSPDMPRDWKNGPYSSTASIRSSRTAGGTRWSEAVRRSAASVPFFASPVLTICPATCAARATSTSNAVARSRTVAVIFSRSAAGAFIMPGMDPMTACVAVATSSMLSP